MSDFEYKGKTYRLCELVDPTDHKTHDIIYIFEVVADKDYIDIPKPINYFYGATMMTIADMIDMAKDYIDDLQRG